MAVSVAILGASGYAGAELLRLLAGHAEVEVTVATADSQQGKKVGELYPSLAPSYPELRFDSLSSGPVNRADVIFSALPHGESMHILPRLQNNLIIDLGSDFRLKNAELYPEFYERAHVCPDQLSLWSYGLPELFREEIVESKRIASPGCYATAIILALAPLVREGLIEDTIVVDAISGTSGAGRGARPGLHFAHVYEDIRAYKIGAHQHTAEVEQSLNRLSPTQRVMVSVTPHLAPMTRGIHATCSAQLVKSCSSQEISQLFTASYQYEPFVVVSDLPPGTKEVRGSNWVRIFPTVDPRTQRVIVVSVLDNLVKGAAGQAIQNMNIALGFSENLGLSNTGLYP